MAPHAYELARWQVCKLATACHRAHDSGGTRRISSDLCRLFGSWINRFRRVFCTSWNRRRCRPGPSEMNHREVELDALRGRRQRVNRVAKPTRKVGAGDEFSEPMPKNRRTP